MEKEGQWVSLSVGFRWLVLVSGTRKGGLDGGEWVCKWWASGWG